MTTSYGSTLGDVARRSALGELPRVDGGVAGPVGGGGRGSAAADR